MEPVKKMKNHKPNKTSTMDIKVGDTEVIRNSKDKYESLFNEFVNENNDIECTLKNSIRKQCMLNKCSCSRSIIEIYVKKAFKKLKKGYHDPIYCMFSNFLIKPHCSVIRDHCHSMDHPLNKSSFEILAKLHNHSDTFLAKSILIRKLYPE